MKDIQRVSELKKGDTVKVIENKENYHSKIFTIKYILKDKMGNRIYSENNYLWFSEKELELYSLADQISNHISGRMHKIY